MEPKRCPPHPSALWILSARRRTTVNVRRLLTFTANWFLSSLRFPKDSSGCSRSSSNRRFFIFAGLAPQSGLFSTCLGQLARRIVFICPGLKIAANIAVSLLANLMKAFFLVLFGTLKFQRGLTCKGGRNLQRWLWSKDLFYNNAQPAEWRGWLQMCRNLFQQESVLIRGSSKGLKWLG